MNDLLLYYLKSILAGAIFTGFYQFAMRRESFLRLNRFYLLTSALLIVVLPLIGSFFALEKILPYHQTQLPVFTLPEVVITSTSLLSPEQESIVLNWMTIVYSSVTLAMLGGFIYSLVRIYHFIRTAGNAVRLKDNIYILPEAKNPFSIFGKVFISRSLIGHPSLQSIIIHENAHLRQKHTVDLILLELLSSIFWFNPFFFLIKNALRETHEFLADREVIRYGTEPLTYQQFLFNVVSGNPQYIIANNFNLLTKKRIVMLIKKSRKIAAIRIGVFMPVIFAAALTTAMLQSNRLIAQIPDAPLPPAAIQMPPPPPPPPLPPVVQDPQKIEKATSKTVTEEKGFENKKTGTKAKEVVTENDVFKAVEDPPKFPGGEEARIQYMVSSIKYPDEARKQGIQGTVYITYIVEPDGSITHAKVLRGIGGGCDEEALRVINGMPKWVPGTQRGKAVRVQFNMPIKFALEGKKK